MNAPGNADVPVGKNIKSADEDDFRDYILAFLFLRYLSDNYEQAAKKELGRDYPDPDAVGNGGWMQQLFPASEEVDA
jgi:type I restriction-modification system DNA methylase subunit